MATFIPNGIVRIGTVPWDTSYQNVRLYESETAQNLGISSFMNQYLEGILYTYVRKDSTIRVEMNAELLYGYNYVMYQNKNYGTKWFYAFIMECNYVNENCTELVIQTDVMQTWMFDYQLMPGFVEREHVADDRRHRNLVPEPEMGFNLVAQNKYTDDDFDEYGIVVQSSTTIFSEYPPSQHTPGVHPTGLAMSGRMYNGVYGGAKMYYWDKDDVDSGQFSLRRFLYLLNQAGSGDAISNIFMFPSAFIGEVGTSTPDSTSFDYYDYFMSRAVEPDNDAPLPHQKSYALPDNLDGYTPRNNKLFTYPYCFMRGEDNSGHYVDWKFELMEPYQTQGGGLVVYYLIYVPIDADAIAFVVPHNYNGEEVNFEHALTFPCTGKCSWQYGAYANWSAQNRLGNVLSAIMGAAPIASMAVKGLSALNAVGNMANTTAILPANSSYYPPKAGYSPNKKEKAAALGGAASLANLAANINRHSLVPNSVRGSANGNSLLGSGKMTYNLKTMVMQRDFAEILDQYFDMYGYQVDSVKVPDINGRPYWNYVKMANANHTSTAAKRVPSDDLRIINGIFDSGVTFWHTDDLGNYSLDNRANTR